MPQRPDIPAGGHTCNRSGALPLDGAMLKTAVRVEHPQRYRLQRFGRGGYIKLALRMGVPILPVAIVGSEETYPLLYKVKPFAKALGMPFVPVTPTFPWLGPLGAVPLPSRWRIGVGEPVSELGAYGPEAADDPIVVNQLNEQVRSRLQTMLDAAVATRGARAYL